MKKRIYTMQDNMELTYAMEIADIYYARWKRNPTDSNYQDYCLAEDKLSEALDIAITKRKESKVKRRFRRTRSIIKRGLLKLVKKL